MSSQQSTLSAQLVIVGAGIVGHSAAYHLARLGYQDVLVIDKGDLYENDGSTSHAPGGVVGLSHSKLLTRFAHYSTNLYADLPPFSPDRNTYNPVGGLEVARSPARWADLIRLSGEAKAFGVEAHLLTPQEAQERHPLLNPDSFVGALFVPSSAIVAGAHVSGALARAAQEAGVRYLSNTRVLDIEVEHNAVTAVRTNNPAQPRIECQAVLLCTNIWAPPIQEKADVELPLMAFEHQYAITESLHELADFGTGKRTDEIVYPTVRDLDYTLYYRMHWDRFGIGSYRHAPRMVDPRAVGKEAKHAFTPHDFDAASEAAAEMFPITAGAGWSDAFNGMFAFSVDGYPIIGETPVRNLWAAVASWITHAGGVGKSVAELITSGESEWDLRQASIDRFLPFQKTPNYVHTVCAKNYREVYDIVHPSQPPTEPRNVRMTPFYPRLQALEAHYTVFAGLELPQWFEGNARLLEKYDQQIPTRQGWGAEHWSRIQGAEHLETRNNAALFDLTGLAVLEVSGRGAPAFLNYLCSNQLDRPVGSVVYTTWLTPGGGIKRDLTVARLSEDRFWLFVGDGTRPQDLAWVRQYQPTDSSVVVHDISDAWGAMGLWGPNARQVLQKVTSASLTNDDFPFYQARWIDVGPTMALALRISYAGELGWELHVPMDAALPAWDCLWAAGREVEMIAAGGGAFGSLRLEKGYRLWGGDIHTEYSPYEAGLGWTVKLNKGDFIGREAARAAKKAGSKKRLCCLLLDDRAATPLGYEPIFDGERCVGHITTADFGYSIGRYIAYGYLPLRLAAAGTELTVEVEGRHYGAVVSSEPLWDPKMARMKA